MRTNIAPLRRRGPKGKHLLGFAPHGRRLTLTFLAALRCDRLTAPCVFNGPINGACFQAHANQLLVLTLKLGDIVILDNLGSHKGKAARHAVHQAGADLSSYLNILPTRNPSSRPSPRSNIGCDWFKSETLKTSGHTSENSSTPSHPMNAQITSKNSGYASVKTRNDLLHGCVCSLHSLWI